jgi:maltose-binding protein MalE
MLTLHKSAHYAAHLLNNSGLVIESTRKTGGVQLRPNHPQYGEYVDAFRTAIDAAEADALCRALLN